jgi:hypothetical protein
MPRHHYKTISVKCMQILTSVFERVVRWLEGPFFKKKKCSNNHTSDILQIK